MFYYCVYVLKVTSIEESVRMTENRDKYRECTTIVWPTLGSRTAKEQNRMTGLILVVTSKTLC